MTDWNDPEECAWYNYQDRLSEDQEAREEAERNA